MEHGSDNDDGPSDPVVTDTWLGAPARSCARRPRLVGEVVARAARRWPDGVAVVDGERSVVVLDALPRTGQTDTQALRAAAAGA